MRSFKFPRLQTFGFCLFASVALVTQPACDGDGGTDGGGLLDGGGGLEEAKAAFCSAEWDCPGGLAQGNASISGNVSIDAFFSAVLSLESASASANASFHAELKALAAELGISVMGKSTTQLAADIQGHVEANLNVHLQGQVELTYEPPKCEADVQVVAKASADCDVNVQPGSVTVQCQGGCDIEATVEAEAKCTGPDLELTCVGQAPELSCSGSCTGDCQLQVAAECTGSCTGSCMGTCTACAGGSCNEENGVITNCTGTCMGNCQGTCELEAGGSCSGKCEGSCEWDPGMAGCTASGSKPHCEVRAGAQASIECDAKCEGEIIPPEVSAECKASVEAKAKAEVTCTPPTVALKMVFKAGVDANVQADVRAQFNVIHSHYGEILASLRKNEIVFEAAGEVAATGVGAVQGAVSGIASAAGALDYQATAGMICATNELGGVGTIMSGVQASAQANIDAMASLRTVLGENVRR